METRLERLDLNLLVVFEALLLEGNVTRAAVRLRRSQPATSRALTQLREALGDPLFLRGRRGVTPTARALELAGPVQVALASLRTALTATPAFDPLTARQTFVVAASDHAQLVFLPALAERLAQWPHLTLRVVSLPSEFPTGALERGELDLVVGLFNLAPGDDAPAHLKRKVLLDEPLCAVGRTGHPALRHPDLATLARQPQLNVSPRGGTRGAFERKGRLDRNIVLYVPHYAAVPWVLAQTRLLAVLPASVAAQFCERFPLSSVPLPVGRTLKLQQLWHPRVQLLPAHRWLRDQVTACAALREGDVLATSSASASAGGRRPSAR